MWGWTGLERSSSPLACPCGCCRRRHRLSSSRLEWRQLPSSGCAGLATASAPGNRCATDEGQPLGARACQSGVVDASWRVFAAAFSVGYM